MSVDVIVIGGGLAGSTLASALARKGITVTVLERETKFKDRVRGENMLPWGVAAARRLGVLEPLVAAGGQQVPFFNVYAMGRQTDHRPFPQTTPSGESSLNMYHPDLQETLLAGARNAGADVRRGTTVSGISRNNGHWSVSFTADGQADTLDARLVVGADGRMSRVREWGSFTVKRDPEHLRIAGTLLDGARVPEDGVHLCMGPGIATFTAPLGHGRARTYFIYVGRMGARQLSGAAKVPAFLEGVRATGAPTEWFEHAQAIGPLAEFDGADQSVAAPARRGLALVGDAAASTDPSWGCGLSKTLVDVETLSSRLCETDDWDEALERYAAAHDEYYGKLHRILSWMTELLWTPGPEADARRARVLPRREADPTGFPDPSGQGPFGPSDEQARRLILGEF